MKLIHKQFAAKIKAAEDESRTVTSIITTGSIDRDNDIIRSEGIDLSAYRKNPVVLWGHDHSMPIAKTISIDHQDNQIVATAEFPPEGISEKADEIYGLIQAGIIGATSVGFRALEYDFNEERDYGIDFNETEVYEYSFVSVPANAEALVIERSAISEDIKARLKAEKDAQEPEVKLQAHRRRHINILRDTHYGRGAA